MKIGELFVEPVLIGFSVLIAAALLFSSQLEEWLLRAELGSLAIAAIAAYFCGIVFDRVADTVLGRLEHHHRLQFALDEFERGSDPAAADPFPEDRYHVAVMGSGEAWEHIYYLRSRIRLMRALLVLIPALGVGAAVRVSDESDIVRRISSSTVVAIYALSMFLRSGKMTAKIDPGKLLDSEPWLPRTYALADFRVREWLKRAAGKQQPLVLFVIRNEPLFWTVPAFALLAVGIGLEGNAVAAGIGLGAGIVAFTMLLCWCWWRITETFFVFLRNFSVLRPQPFAERETCQVR